MMNNTGERNLPELMMPTEIRHESLSLPTYETAPENPNPCFTKRLGAHTYPYRLQDGLTGRRTIVAYDAVILENEYIRLTFLPDFGCRLFSAFDKILGREMFYRNDCIKPALIATRGAWISGGVEFNFPVSHSVYTHSRIPHTARQNADGSASFVFGLTEQMTGLRFTVDVRLAPGEYRFSEVIRLYNGTSLPHRHYWWTNAAVQLTPETQMIYPMHFGISGLYGDRTPWPVCEGVDLSWARNHTQAGDVFGSETYDEFFGVYHWEADCGIAHWARQEEMPARKMFFWGADEMGERWQRMLTENAGDYLEIQAGRFATQSDFDMLMPHETVEMTEYWIPVGKTDGYVKAHPEGVVNIVPGGGKSRIAVQLTTSRPASKVLLLDDTRLAQEISHSFEAGRVYWFDANVPAERLSVTILSDHDEPFLCYNPGDKEQRHDLVPRTSVMPKQTEAPDDILKAAHVHERMNSPATSISMYERLIGTEHEMEARKGLARFALAAGRNADAEKHARCVLKPSVDPETKYLLALAIDECDESSQLLQSLVGDMTFDKPARIMMAKIAIRSNNYQAALSLTDSADGHPGLLLLRAVAARKVSKNELASSAIAELLSSDPLLRVAKWEQVALGLCDAVEVTNESFQEDMDAAEWYHGLGLDSEAKSVLSAWAQTPMTSDPFYEVLAAELGMTPQPNHTEVYFGVTHCYAHRDTLLAILQQRTDPQSQLHLANMLYSHGRTDEAISAWKDASSDEDAMAFRGLSLAYWHAKNDLESAYQYMRQAHEADQHNADTLRDLDIIAERAGKHEAREKIGEDILKYVPDDSRCIERAVRIFIEAGRLDQAVELITTKRFFVAELAYQTRILYVRALLMRGTQRFMNSDYAGASDDFQLATEYPENLGVGRIKGGSDAQAYYLLGLSLDGLGRGKEASAAWTTAAADEPVYASEQAYYVGMARRRVGRSDANDAFARLADTPPNDQSDLAKARTHYLSGLAALASGDVGQSVEHFAESHRIESANPVAAHNYLEQLCYTRSHGRRLPIPVWWTVEPVIPKNRY